MLVFGYHGTFEEAAKSMCQNEFKFKDGDHHWLGNGIWWSTLSNTNFSNQTSLN